MGGFLTHQLLPVCFGKPFNAFLDSFGQFLG